MKRESKTDPINRALMFIEEHLAEEICVDDIAQRSAISRYHLNRVFAYATGYSLARSDGTHIQWFKPDPNWKQTEIDWTLDSDQHCEGEIWVPIK